MQVAGINSTFCPPREHIASLGGHLVVVLPAVAGYFIISEEFLQGTTFDSKII